MNKKIKITPFLDDTGRITMLPGKHSKRLAVLEYLSGKFELNCSYSEQQVNEICDRWHTFEDYFILRRELVDSGMLNRERDGSRYWRAPEDTATADE